VTKKENWLSGGTDPVSTYAYDSYGNKTSETDANGHTTTSAFGTNDTTYTYPDSTTNAKSQTTAATYDLGTGNVLTKTDPSGNTTTYTYDVFGRITKEIRAYDSSTYPTKSYQYFFDGVAPEGVLVSQRKVSGASGTYDSYAYTDGLGRTIQTRSDAEDTSKQTVKDTLYDKTNQIYLESIPHLDTLSTTYTASVSGIKNTSYTYDPIGRVTAVKNPKGDSKTIAYDHWKETITDENGHVKKQYKNAFGKINKVEEVNGGSTYTTLYT